MTHNQEFYNNFPEVDGLHLLHISKHDESRKIYLINNRVVKVRIKDKDSSQHKRQNDYREEFEILKRCANLKGVPKAIDFYEDKTYQFLLLDFISGTTFSDKKISFLELIKILTYLSKILISVSLRGVSHNDIQPENILISNSNKVFLIDFDQATYIKKHKALLSNFFGINHEERKANFSMLAIIKNYFATRFPKMYLHIRKYSKKGYREEIQKLPKLRNEHDEKLHMLLNAWKIAQRSNASSPGYLVAYYAYKYGEIVFPGERSWIDRWETLRRITDFNGKKILELGCNMGLLSSTLLKDAKAKSAMGVDIDKEIIKAANIISDVLNVKPDFSVLDFDSNENWEIKLINFQPDIVFVLNVYNWVNDKERFLKFLSNFSELIFEGHEPISVETERLKKIGYNKVKLVGYSERGRCLLHCRK